MRNRNLRNSFLLNFIKNAKTEDLLIQLQYLDVLDKQNAYLITENNSLRANLDKIYSYLNNSVFLKNNVDPQVMLEEINLLCSDDDVDDDIDGDL